MHLTLCFSTKMEQNLHPNDHLYLTTSHSDSFWLIETIVVVAPPQSGQPDQPFPATNLAVHDDYFEPMFWILLDGTKGQDLTPVEIKRPSFNFYK
jgi:hypothetical protein